MALAMIIGKNKANAVAAAAAIEPVSRLLGPDNEDPIRICATRALGCIALYNDANRAAAVVAIAPLARRMLELDDSSDGQHETCFVLCNLIIYNKANRASASVAIAPLSRMLSSSATGNVGNAQVEIDVVKALRCLCQGDAAHQAAAAAAVSPLVRLLGGHVDATVVAYALSDLVDNDAVNQTAAADAGAFPQLIRLLEPGNSADVQTSAACALSSMMRNNTANKVSAIAAIAPLMRLLGPEIASSVHIAVTGTLCNLLNNCVANQAAAAPAVAPLTRLLGGENASLAQVAAAKALYNLANANRANKASAAVAIVPLIRMLEPGNPDAVILAAVRTLGCVIHGTEANRVAAWNARVRIHALSIDEGGSPELRSKATRTLRMLLRGEPSSPATPARG